MRETGGFSFPPFQWFLGVVENRHDPKKLGRVQVRIFGYHTGDMGKIPTESLPWAIVSQDITSAANSGVGRSPTGIVEGTTVWGFFADGENAQTPVVVGTLAGMNEGQGFEGGFKDPNGKYPREKGENDVNKLARSETSDTIVEKKKDSLEEAEIAFGGKWKEKKTEYSAKYPYNHVFESESGHVLEFDDTEGSERIGLWHRKGTFDEIHPDGSRVTKIVKDNYSIVLKDDYVLIKGNAKVTIMGNSSLNIKGNADILVAGNVKEEVKGNYSLKVGGNYDVQVGKTESHKAGVHFKVNAPRIDLN